MLWLISVNGIKITFVNEIHCTLGGKIFSVPVAHFLLAHLPVLHTSLVATQPLSGLWQYHQECTCTCPVGLHIESKVTTLTKLLRLKKVTALFFSRFQYLYVSTGITQVFVDLETFLRFMQILFTTFGQVLQLIP